MNRPPNVIYLNAHDMGRYIGPYGYPVPTPNLQRFARDAVVFRNCFCMGPTCSPSRAAMLTGQSPHNSGMLGLAHRGWGLNDYGQHWVHALHEAGYTSHFTGGQHIAQGSADDPLSGTRRIGYQHIHEAMGQLGWAERAAKLIQDKPDEPFYLEVGFSDCHRRGQLFPPGELEDDPRFMRSPAPLPDHPAVRREFAGYCSLAREYDHHVGIILGALADTGLDASTVVIITTDHGIDFTHMKCTLRDDGIGVYLMMRGPTGSAWRGGKVVDSLVSHIDVYPTLCELTGAPRREWLQGHSLCPIVEGQADEVREEVHAEVTYHAAYQPMRAVRTKRWKYFRRFYDRPTPIPPNQSPCPTRSVWEEFGWFDRVDAREELYDVLYDPNEANNLAENPQYAEVLADMRGRLKRWMEGTKDPILDGHVPMPAGGKTTRWDEYSNSGKIAEAEEWNAFLKTGQV